MLTLAQPVEDESEHDEAEEDHVALVQARADARPLSVAGTGVQSLQAKMLDLAMKLSEPPDFVRANLYAAQMNLLVEAEKLPWEVRWRR